MITVEIIRQQSGITRFKAVGHAGQDWEGSDIVCSAVVAVVYGAIGALGDLCWLNEYEDVAEDKPSDYVSFEIPEGVSNQTREKAQIILETMFIGLKQIEHIYDDYVKINEREV